MAERGELRATDGHYELAGRIGGRRGAQDWSLAPKLPRWDGMWRFGVVHDTARDAAARAALRDAMRHLRHRELREGVWVRPDNLPTAAAAQDAWSLAEAQCAWWSGRPGGDPAAIARELFAFDDWARAARAHTKVLARATRDLDRGEAALAAAFVAGTAAVAHLRADPLLPGTLVSGADGDALRTAYGEYEVTFARALRTWFRRH